MQYEPGPKLIEKVLRQQGLVPSPAAGKDQLLIPLRIIEADTVIHNELLDRFRTAFDRSTFRKIARALTAAKRSFVPRDKLRGIAGEKVEDYLGILAAFGVLEDDESGVRLTPLVDNIGPTLEWYVADLCERDFLASATWAVQLEDMPAGGDYDVLACLSTGLLYVETKTAAPQDITDEELFNLLLRTAGLQPEIVVLLVDTDDELEGLVKRLIGIANFPTPATRTHWSSLQDWAACPRSFVRIPNSAGIYFGAPLMYVVNSHATISAQLRRCLRHHHITGRAAFIARHVPDPVETVDRELGLRLRLSSRLV